jgi:exonuclease VII small subunit
MSSKSRITSLSTPIEPSIKSKMIHWAQAAKLRISPMTSTTPIEWSIQSLEDRNRGLEDGNQGFEDGNQGLEDGNQSLDNVKLAIQIQTSEVEQLRQEVDEYRKNKVPKNYENIHSAKETNNYDEDEDDDDDDDDDDEQIHSAKKTNNYDEDADIDNMICLFKVLMAAILFCLCL